MPTDMKFKMIPSWLGWILLASFAVNLVQAGFTPLDPDEAYYWMYSLKPDFGYFDHPPAVALFIKAGTWLLPGTAGIRLGTVLLNTITLLISWILAGRPDDKRAGILFMAILLSMPFLQVYAFIATPDAPLLFFSVLYIFIFDRALTTNKTSWFVLLGVCMAALLYSKYHGLLVILFLLFAHFRLLLNYRFYLAGIIGVLLFLPHLYWQYIHDFPSFKYHLKGRDDPYELKHTITYIINQLVIFSPLFLPYTIRAMKQLSADTVLNKSFRVLIYGFLLFFLYTTFKGHAEPQWTAVLSIPFSIIVWKYAMTHGVAVQKKVFSLAVVTISILAIARIVLIIQPETTGFSLNMQHKTWVEELKQRANGRPVIFQNSYRNASVYSYYSGEKAYTITDRDYRKNQFDIWDDEKDLFGKKVLIVGNQSMHCDGCENVRFGLKNFVLANVDSFQAFGKIVLMPESDLPALSRNIENPMSIKGYNPYPHAVVIGPGDHSLRISALLYHKTDLVQEIPLIIPENTILNAQDSFKIEGLIRIPQSVPPGKYDLIMGLGMKIMPASKNSPKGLAVVVN